jgi:dCTP deaminase
MNADALLFPELLDEPVSLTTGLLPSQRLEELIDAGYIRASTPISDDQIQPSSIDLLLGPVAYRVPASFLPNSRSTVRKKRQDLKICQVDLTSAALLEKGTVYIVTLQEELFLRDDLSAMANPKSSTGRVDLFIRLITDYGDSVFGIQRCRPPTSVRRRSR